MATEREALARAMYVANVAARVASGEFSATLSPAWESLMAKPRALWLGMADRATVELATAGFALIDAAGMAELKGRLEGMGEAMQQLRRDAHD